jgi:hypothetical protein
MVSKPAIGVAGPARIGDSFMGAPSALARDCDPEHITVVLFGFRECA